MKTIPREKFPDSTITFLRDPYRFISKRCEAHGTDLFEARLQLEKVICITGKEATELFYDTDRFTREDAAPARIQKTLFGEGGVQGIDGEGHVHRKGMLLSLLTPEKVGVLSDIATAEWAAESKRWNPNDVINLYERAQRVLTRAVCSWAGVPLDDDEVELRAEQLTELFDSAGALGPRHWAARRARGEAEEWLGDLVASVRKHPERCEESCALSVVASYQDDNGKPLPKRIAAVELLNILRPTVAVSVYVNYVALALYRYPDCSKKLESNFNDNSLFFAQEVRRLYPFFPVVTARVRRDFEWNDYLFPWGRLVVLDLYGTNHDPRLWDCPDEFRPERFRDWKSCPFSFIPQGGGDEEANHRCPGEGAALALMCGAMDFLVNTITYEVPKQDLEIDMSRLPALPQSGFNISNVRPGSLATRTAGLGCPYHES